MSLQETSPTPSGRHNSQTTWTNDVHFPSSTARRLFNQPPSSTRRTQSPSDQFFPPINTNVSSGHQLDPTPTAQIPGAQQGLPAKPPTPEETTQFYDSLQKVKDLLINETLVLAPKHQKNVVLDLINVFRDYFETGTVRGQFQHMEKQLVQLDHILKTSRKIGKEAVPKPVTQKNPEPISTTIPASFTLAQIAALGNPTQQTQQIKPKKNPNKNSK